jgi:hypothetical protein
MRSENKVRELAIVCLPWYSRQKPQYRLMTLAYRRFKVVLLLIYGSLYLRGVYYCLSVFCCSVTKNSWILHHDNAPAHMALSMRKFLASKQITVLEHPPYSPDLAPNDLFLFPR